MDGTITVKGVGTATTKPDYVKVFMNINSEKPTYDEAISDANQRIALLQNSLISAGYAKDDLKTLDFSVDSRYDSIEENGRYRREFAGYSCSYRLKISFDFSQNALAKTLNAVADSGSDAEFTITFTVKEPEKLSEQLLISATENARAKAEALCKASGKKLGEILSIDYNWGEILLRENSIDTLSRAVPLAAMPDFTPDDINSSDTVTFVWKIV